MFLGARSPWALRTDAAAPCPPEPCVKILNFFVAWPTALVSLLILKANKNLKILNYFAFLYGTSCPWTPRCGRAVSSTPLGPAAALPRQSAGRTADRRGCTPCCQDLYGRKWKFIVIFFFFGKRFFFSSIVYNCLSIGGPNLQDMWWHFWLWEFGGQ